MALDLRIAGPSFEVTRRLQQGEPAVVLGRDTDCTICLPDPDRNVSRRHLSVWNEGDQLHFHVLSVVNGVETPMGDLPPGARGVLAPGHTMALSAYRLVVLPVADAAAHAGSTDPWEEFERQAAVLAADAGPETVPAPMDEDDPFGDWGFQSTFGPGAPGGPLRADALSPATDLQPFFAGLGLDATAPASYTRGELETLGRVVRIALHGLLQATQAAALTRQDARSEDRTMVEAGAANPLRLDTPVEGKLSYLFGGQVASAGFMPPDRAMAQLATELTLHEQAMGDALRETLEAVLADFDPDTVKTRLLGTGARLFESARAWDAFARDYAERRSRGDEWVQQLLDRHFARAYTKALLRAKRNTPARSRS
jgi:predicted component of type VI protein secretion system